jgi:hypothetical protein
MLIVSNIFMNAIVGQKANIQKWSEMANVEGGSLCEFVLWPQNRV